MSFYYLKPKKIFFGRLKFAQKFLMNNTFLTQQDDKELQVLRNIYRRDKIRQRDLAAVVGMSLGMTNVIVKRLVSKGLLSVRKINNRNIMYVVSPSGIEEIAKRSYKYFKRTLKNIIYYKNSIDDLVREVKDAGFSSLSLIGSSDVDFIVEHICGKYDIAYRQQRDEEAALTGSFILYGENARVGGRAGEKQVSTERKAGKLRDILVRI
jgi:DNA-binding MarR family transcriptional regulator